MASEGPLSPSTIVNATGIGTIAWQNPGNAAASDDVRAQADMNPADSTNWLKATDFDFSEMADDDTVDGIVLEIERSDQNSGDGLVSDLGVRLVVAGVIQATDKSAVGNWPGTPDAYQSYGGAAETWGETLTGADVKVTGFGAALAVQEASGDSTIRAYVDHMRMTVYYTLVATGQPARARGAFVPGMRQWQPGMRR
ncbi:MAG TPA: hypothetical protein VJL08_03645 [Dehalococcoidia bacterium]|nr:hypothetical protein [Dehalococcoidia bacterium]